MRIIGITSSGVLALALGIAAPVYAQHDQQGEKQDHPQERQAQHEQARPEPQHAQEQRQAEQKPQQQQHAQQQKQSEPPQQHAQQQRQDRQDRPQHAQPQTRQDHPAAQEHAQRQQRQDQNDRTQHAQQPSHRTTETQQRAQQQRQDHPQHPQQGRSSGQRSPEQQRVQQTAWREHGSRNWESEHRTWEQRGGYRGYRIPDDRFRGYFGSNHGFRIYGLPFLVVGGYPRFQYEGYWFSPVDPWPEYWGDSWYDNDEVYVVYANNGYYLYNRRYPTVGLAINISM